MRKKIIKQVPEETATPAESEWLDLETAAQVEVTSEDSAHAIEAALLPDKPGGWRADRPGEQTIRLQFDEPQNLKRIRLLFDERDAPRTQEFVLRWSQTPDGPLQEVVRQQYNFSPPGTMRELEEYNVELKGVAILELAITPDTGGGAARASLAEFRVAAS